MTVYADVHKYRPAFSCLGAEIEFYSVENRFAENIVLLKLPISFSESWDKS
jgi:hypothetical protein